MIRTFCAWCGKKEKIDGKWVAIDKLPRCRASHGICDECKSKMIKKNDSN